MNIIIIEDETPNYIELRNILSSISSQIVTSQQLASVTDVRSYLLTHNDYDLIFADIRLEDGLVFEALTDFINDTPVVFTTAYDEYAIKAFDYNGIAYLLKPIQLEDVKQALKRERQRRISSDNFKELMKSLQEKACIYRQHFLVTHAEYSEVISINNVSHITTENGITRIFLTNGHSSVINYSLDELCQQLNPNTFFRANRQCIIRIDHVKRLHNWFNGKTQIEIDCYPGQRIDISKERTIKLKQWLNK